MSPLQRAINHVGSQTALASILNIAQPTVSEWNSGDRPVPAERAADIERVTEGLVTCEQLRPDLRWARINDKHWPHTKGRPVLDLTKAIA